MIDALGMLLMGLAGSAHCGAMCGAVFGACAQGAGAGARRLVCLHAGRLASYALLGAACGAAGSLVDWGAAAVAWPRLAAVAAGVVMVLLAAEQLGWLRRLQSRLQPGDRPEGDSPAARFLAAAFRMPGGKGAFAVGAALGLLPCGLLYSAAALAAGSADPVRGAWLMALFAAGGSLPLAGLGRLLGWAWQRGSGRILNQTAAVLVLALGLGTLAARLAGPDLPGHSAASHAHSHDRRDSVQE